MQIHLNHKTPTGKPPRSFPRSFYLKSSSLAGRNKNFLELRVLKDKCGVGIIVDYSRDYTVVNSW